MHYDFPYIYSMFLLKTPPRFLFLLFLGLYGTCLLAQQSDSLSLSLSAYADAYYARFNDQRGLNALQQYTTVSPRHNVIGLNIGSIGLHLRGDKFRVNTVFHAGDIPAATWSADFPVVQAANAGIKLADGLWLDGGFFATHLGTESFLPKENLLSSTAVATYNEPFYQAGFRLGYETQSNWRFELWALNGYNRFLDNNSDKALGVLIAKDFSDNTTLSYSNILGNEQDIQSPVSQFRLYQNVYFSTSSDSWQLILGGDLGLQSNSKNGTEMATMYNALLTLRYKASKQFSITGRGEIFRDPQGFVSGSFDFPAMNKGLDVYGLTLGASYKPSEQSYLRLESRMLRELEGMPLFNNSSNSAARVEVMITLGAFFDELEIWRKK